MMRTFFFKFVLKIIIVLNVILNRFVQNIILFFLESSSVQEMEPPFDQLRYQSTIGNGLTTSISLPVEIPQSKIF